MCERQSIAQLNDWLCFMYKILNNTTERLYSFKFWDFSEVRDPVPLRHFGKWEVLAKIDLIEDRCDAPMLFDATKLPPMPFMPGQGRGAWGPGLQCPARPGAISRQPVLLHWWQTCLGLHLRREMEETKAYLQRNGNYQLEQVGEQKFILHDSLNNWTIV